MGSLRPPTFCLSFTLYSRELCGQEKKNEATESKQDVKPKPTGSQSCEAWGLQVGAEPPECSRCELPGRIWLRTQVVPAAQLGEPGCGAQEPALALPPCLPVCLSPHLSVSPGGRRGFSSPARGPPAPPNPSITLSTTGLSQGALPYGTSAQGAGAGEGRERAWVLGPRRADNALGRGCSHHSRSRAAQPQTPSAPGASNPRREGWGHFTGLSPTRQDGKIFCT